MTPASVPIPGSVIRYAYLWADESAKGAEEGRKDRPALVLALSVRTEGDEATLLVVAVTHSPPSSDEEAIVFPEAEKRRLGLDDARSWIVTTEGNAFVWPGPDVRPVPGRDPATLIYGTVSQALLRRVARAYLANRGRQRTRMVTRTT